MKNRDLRKRVFSILNQQEFEELSLEIFRKQATELEIYRTFLKHLRVDPSQVKTIDRIPFLPIEFFKSQSLIWPATERPEIVFTSSGTTGMQTSRHPVLDLEWYKESYLQTFQIFYGDVDDWTILALLPSYQEREGSSLIYMADDLIRKSRHRHPESGYFLYDHDRLHQQLEKLKANRKKTILIGVTYALLDFVEKYRIRFPELIVMETGGMKGRRKEMIREEVHALLGEGFGVRHIHSEYGMTELLSQGYSLGNGIFQSPPWMKVLIRDIHDHFDYLPAGRTGGVNIIDLANYHGCSFLATQDLGRLVPADLIQDESPQQLHSPFEILGRFDNSDIRGCNLLVG